jgi:hypothetical protein
MIKDRAASRAPPAAIVKYNPRVRVRAEGASLWNARSCPLAFLVPIGLPAASKAVNSTEN